MHGKTKGDKMRNQKPMRGERKNILQTLEQKLSDHPQVGAVILDGLVVACSRASELLSNLEKQLRERADEIRGGSKNERAHARAPRSAGSPA